MVTTPPNEGAPGGRGDLFDVHCPTRLLLDRVGGKWVSMAIILLSETDGPELGFAQLNRRMPGISHKMLSNTLKGLVRDGLVTRRVESSVPPRVHYSLTPLGRGLSVPLSALREWAETHAGDIPSLAG